jgi:hypothetical protein
VLEAASPTPGYTSFILVGAFDLDPGSLGVVLRCEQSQQRHRDGQPIVFADHRLFDLADQVDAVEVMTSVYKATRDPAALVDARRPRLLLLGGDSKAVENGVQAVAAVLGFRAEVFARPESNVERARQAIAQRRDLIAIWVGSMPHRPDVVERLAARAADSGLDVLRLTSEAADSMLDDLTLELSSYEFERSPPTSMPEALSRARTSCPHLSFLPEAESSAAASPFWRPDDVLRAVEELDDVVRRWRAGELAAGVHQALKEAPVSYASDISATAKGKYGGYYVVSYQGGNVMLGPHLKFGKKSPERCARVYWFVDHEAKTFVIGHFGRHLPDDTS